MDERKKEQLMKMSSSLSISEEMALIGYNAKKDIKGAKRRCFEMTLFPENPLWSEAKWLSQVSLFYKRSDVEAYLQLLEEQDRERIRTNAAVASDMANIKIKTYEERLKDIEVKIQLAEMAGDEEAVETWYDMALKYSKVSDDNITDEDKRVSIYAPSVCVDRCPMHRIVTDMIERSVSDMIEKYTDVCASFAKNVAELMRDNALTPDDVIKSIKQYADVKTIQKKG